MSFQTDLYDSLLADIFNLTNRPDLEVETELALKTATRSAHHSDFYNRDLVTNLVQLPNGTYQVQLDVANLFPRLRGIDTIVPTDVNFAAISDQNNQIEILEIGDIRDSDGVLRNNIAYLAGTSLNIRTAIQVYGFIVGWYRSPSALRTQYDSWIAQLFPDAIIYWAAAIVLNTNGNEDKANRYLKQVNEIYLPYLRNNYLLGKAR